MYFRNEHHRQAFKEGVKKADAKDKETLGAVYLLSADPCLWRRAKQASIYGKILLNNIRLTNNLRTDIFCLARRRISNTARNI